MVQVREKLDLNANWVKMYRDGEGMWDVGQKPKSKVVLKEGQETEDKEIVLNKAIKRKLERIVIRT